MNEFLKIRFPVIVALSCMAFAAQACSSSAGSSQPGATGGAPELGGNTPIGGTHSTATGGSKATTAGTSGAMTGGGNSSAGGRLSATGGANSGGHPQTGGGTYSTGGAVSVGGTVSTGGSTQGNTGGSAGPGCTGSLTAEDPSVYNARRPSTSNRYLPMSVGAHWGWQETDVATGTSGQRQAWVASSEQMTGTKAGITAYRVQATTLKGGQVNWQQDTNASVVRHRVQDIDTTGTILTTHELVPSKLHLDEATGHLVVGATWTETYTDTKTTQSSGAVVTATVNVTWTVEAINESVTVPAGTFSCVRVHRVEAASAVDANGADNVYWYARGVGKVKETGTINHELLGYCYP